MEQSRLIKISNLVPGIVRWSRGTTYSTVHRLQILLNTVRIEELVRHSKPSASSSTLVGSRNEFPEDRGSNK